MMAVVWRPEQIPLALIERFARLGGIGYGQAQRILALADDGQPGYFRRAGEIVAQVQAQRDGAARPLAPSQYLGRVEEALHA